MYLKNATLLALVGVIQNVVCCCCQTVVTTEYSHCYSQKALASSLNAVFFVLIQLFRQLFTRQTGKQHVIFLLVHSSS